MVSGSAPYPKRQKHHYIPQFYLKQWAGPDGRICEFSPRYKGIVKPRMTYPAGTGYVENLYTLSGLPAETAQILEEKFFKPTDQFASDALDILLSGTTSEVSLDARSGWARFVMSLIHRHPEKVSWIKEEVESGFRLRTQDMIQDYESSRRPSDPQNFEEYVAINGASFRAKAFAMFLRGIIDSQNVGASLSGMKWSVLTIEDPTHHFLTSDRPVIMSDGIKYADSFVIVPLSPASLFLAVNTPRQEQNIQNKPLNELTREVNSIVCRQAQKYVYGTNNL